MRGRVRNARRRQVGDGVEEVGQPHAFQQERGRFTGGREGDFLPFAFMLPAAAKCRDTPSGLTRLNHLPRSCRFLRGVSGANWLADGFAAVREDAFERIVARHAL